MPRLYDKLFEFYKHLCTVVTGVTLMMVGIAGQTTDANAAGLWLFALALSAEVFSLVATVSCCTRWP